MNFPNATAEDWARARGIIFAGARRAGYDAAAADDMAQNAMLAIMGRNYRHGMPEGPVHAACILRRQARRLGWHTLNPQTANERRRSQDRRQDREAHVVAVAIGRSVTPSPASMAEHAERLRVPVYRVHEANGIGPGALAEPGHTPSVYGSGPATPTPVAGSRLSRLETDPNPVRTLQATHPACNPPQWRTGADLDHYRDQLAQYYGPRPLC